MDDNEDAIDLLNRTPTEDIWRLEDDPRMTKSSTLFLASGILRYTRSPRCEVRRQLLISSAGPEDDAYWQQLADRVKVEHMPGERCPNGICPDDPYRRGEHAL